MTGKNRPLPVVSMTPSARSSGQFPIADAWPDQEEGGLVYLQLYCAGMDLSIRLDIEQAELVVARLQERITEEKELTGE